jgi:Uma2 family endonuclease
MIIRTPTAELSLPTDWKFSDLLDRLGDVVPERIRLNPWPGQATDEDCTESKDRFGCLCEMVDGVLVEKVMGFEEARLATALAHLIGDYLVRHPLGIVFGADGPVRVDSRVIRMPDVSFISWDRLPEDEDHFPEGPVMELAPDLAVEVISRGNRPGEMAVKLREYFERGVGLVWYVYFKDRYAKAFTDPKQSTRIDWTDSLDGGDVLPGFKIRLQELYEQAFPTRPKKRRGR